MIREGGHGGPPLHETRPPVVAVRHALMLQRWTSLTFLHWSYPPEVIRPLVPADLDLDLWEGRAYVGIVAFLISRLRPPFLPALPWISKFPETNVRTYVKDRRGDPGVWFFSLDAARLAAVIGARLSCGLPYVWSNMRVVEGREVLYTSSRITPGRATSRIRVDVGTDIPEAEQTALDLFLTARYRLYSRLLGRLAYAQVEHSPYPLSRVKLLDVHQELLPLPIPAGDPLVHFSPGVSVRVGAPKLATGHRPPATSTGT